MNQKGFIGLLLLILVVIGILIGVYLVAQRTNLLPQASISKHFTNTNAQQKNIITVQISNYLPVGLALTRTTAFNSYNPSSKQTKEFLKFQGDTIIHEAAVSSDGQKVYYISSNFLGSPSSVTIVNSSGSKKEYKLAQDNLWTLSNPGNLGGSGKRDCYWSPNGSKLACLLLQRESSPNGAGTGRSDIVVLDSSSGNIVEAFNSDQVAQPQRAMIDMVFGGWAGNNKLLVVHTGNNGANADIQPADFYTVDVNTKTPQKQLSYQYDGGFPVAATPQGDKVFIDSFSRVNEEKLVIYDILSKQFTTILSSKDTLSISPGYIVASEDGTKMVYSTILNKLIHTYDLASNKDTTISNPQPIFSVQGLLSDNKTFLVNKTRENSSLFDTTTQQFEDLKGLYIGSGRF